MGVRQIGASPLNNTLLMTESRPEYYGRVMSVYMLSWSLFPFMAGPMGVVADQVGAVTTFAVLGVGIVVFVALVVLLNPAAIRRSEVTTSRLSRSGN